MEVKDKIKVLVTVSCVTFIKILLDKRQRRLKSCYLKTEETKCQHKFKRVLADNSYAPFEHFNFHENSTDLHPYESEIKALLEKPQLDVKFSNGTMGGMKDAYVWVDDEEKLKQLVEVLNNERVFAVDTEQHSLRSFLGFTALVQISTRDEDYLVDTIALHDVMGILGPVFANPNICKVFHGANNDVIWLQRDFHIYVVNLFDTAKACDVLSKPHRSLAYLLETYCGVITNKFYQREDWRQRPLPKKMLEYARMDAHYLLYIAECLVAELKLKKNGSEKPHNKTVRMYPVFYYLLCTVVLKILSESENPASLDDNKLDFVYEASRRSNSVCLQLFIKELEASPGQSAASSIISRHLNDPGSSTDNSQARMHDESLKYVLSDNAIVALAEKVPVTETDISTTISQADTHLGFLNSDSTTRSLSSVVSSHLVDFHFLLQGELQNSDEILQLYIRKHLGPNGSCPLSLYNYGLLSKSNIKVPKRSVSKENGDKCSKRAARKASGGSFCKSPVYDSCKIYDNDGRLLCYSNRRKLKWYLQRDLAELVDEDPPAIRLLFERKGRPENKGNDFYIQRKENICVGCGEGNHYLRYHIIPSCYRIHFPEHLKTHHDVVLVCVDCHKKAHAFAEKYQKKVASDHGIPLFVHKVVNSSEGDGVSGGSTSVMKLCDGGVSLLELRKAVITLLRHGPRMPPQRREELTQVVRKYYGRREISNEDMENALLVGMSPHGKKQMRKKRGLFLNRSSKIIVSETTLNSDIEDGADASKNEINELENGSMVDSDINSELMDVSAEQNGSINVNSDGAVIAKCSSKLSLSRHGPHGKQVVDYLLMEHGEDGIREFCQRWRQVFVEAINPRFLPAGWDVTHSARREFGDFSVSSPANKGSPSAAKDSTV